MDGFSEGDVLVEQGLVDPATGTAIPTADWNPNAPSTSESGAQESETPEGESAAPQPTQQVSIDWESDQNPYKSQAQQNAEPDPVGEAKTYREQTLGRLQQDASQALALLTSIGLPGPDGEYHPVPLAQAQQMVEMQVQAQRAEVERQAERMALAPIAREAAARQIAKELSIPGAEVKPEELMKEPSVAAMQARARTLVEVRRDTKFESRTKTGQDATEGGASGGSVDYSKLSGFDMIRLGVARDN